MLYPAELLERVPLYFTQKEEMCQQGKLPFVDFRTMES